MGKGRRMNLFEGRLGRHPKPETTQEVVLMEKSFQDPCFPDGFEGIYSLVDPDYIMIPHDTNGFYSGTFKIKIVWTPEEPV